MASDETMIRGIKALSTEFVKASKSRRITIIKKMMKIAQNKKYSLVVRGVAAEMLNVFTSYPG
jgi:hypothetical protein